MTAKDLVKGLLTKDPSKRLTAAEALSHDWLLTAGQEDLTHGNVDKIKLIRYNEKMQVRFSLNALIPKEIITIILEKKNQKQIEIK